jgi:hypothetical protein
MGARRQLSTVELLAAYDDARRRFAEKKFARDTQRARLEWLRAKAFAASSGGVSERRYAVEASEDMARKGQELREMTRDLDLLKVDVDIIAMIARLRSAPAGPRHEGRGTGRRRSPQRKRVTCTVRAAMEQWPDGPSASGRF